MDARKRILSLKFHIHWTRWFFSSQSHYKSLYRNLKTRKLPYKDLHFKATEYFSPNEFEMKTHQNIQIRMPNLIVIPSLLGSFILAFWFIRGEGMDSVLADSTTGAQFNTILWSCLLSLWSYFRNESKTDLCLEKPCSFIQYLKAWWEIFKFLEGKASFLFLCSRSSTLRGTHNSILLILYLLSKIYLICTHRDMTGIPQALRDDQFNFHMRSIP